MAGIVRGGPLTFEGGQDAEGYRTYEVVHLVETLFTDGPHAAMTAAGLPLIGTVWLFGTDLDIWAFCTPERRVTIHDEKEGDPNRWYEVTSKFSTRSMGDCEDLIQDDPLLMPQKVSGTFVKYTKEVTKDRHGNALKTTSHEVLRGPQMEFDHNRPTVRVEQNIAALGLNVFAEMVDTVNDRSLWGLGPRKIKLSNVTWERKRHSTCNFYYTRIFDFDVDFKTFDRVVQDEGTKALCGEWDMNEDSPDYQKYVVKKAAEAGDPNPDPSNPQHFTRYRDKFGEFTRVILDENGLPANSPLAGERSGNSGAPNEIDVEYYDESNLLTLGIPTSF